MRRLVILALCTAGLGGCRWGDDFKLPPPSTTRLPSAADQPYYDAQNAVALKLALQVEADGRGNMAFSPLAAEHDLLMLMTGSSNKARDETMALFGADEDNKTALFESQRALLNRLQGLPERPFRVGSAVFTVWPIVMDKGYSKRVGEAFGSPARKLGAAGVESTRLINEWASQATGGRVPSIVQGLDRDEPLLVFGIADLRGDWFAGWRGENLTFSIAGAATPVPAFADARGYRARSSDVSEAVVLPFAGGELSLVVLVPKGGGGPLDALREVESVGWPAFRASYQVQPMKVVVPEFSVEQSASLNDAFAAVGCPSLFTEDCNLRPMSIEMERGYTVSKVGHWASITTTHPPRDLVQYVGQSRSFVADRPFAFIVSDEKTGVILMVGVVSDPRRAQ